MKKKALNILIVPEDHSKIKKFKIPILSKRIVLSACSIFFLAVSFFIYDYIQLKLKSRELYGFKKENIEQKLQLQTFSTKIAELELQINKLRQFDRKLRIITNLEQPTEQGQYLGLGGPSQLDILPSTKEAKDHLVKQMFEDVKLLTNEVQKQEKSFNELHEHLLRQTSLLSATPTIMPTYGWTTSGFGYRTSPFTGLKDKHEGLDIANAIGTPVIAPGDGIVLKIARDPSSGKMLIINHGYGIITKYAHLSEIYVKVGKKVKRGDKIAAVGNTGRSTGPHLHYQIEENGISVNPHKYILE